MEVRDDGGDKVCSKCKVSPRRPGQRWCDGCKKEYNRQYWVNKREKDRLVFVDPVKGKRKPTRKNRRK